MLVLRWVNRLVISIGVGVGKSVQAWNCPTQAKIGLEWGHQSGALPLEEKGGR